MISIYPKDGLKGLLVALLEKINKPKGYFPQNQKLIFYLPKYPYFRGSIKPLHEEQIMATRWGGYFVDDILELLVCMDQDCL